MDFRSAKRLVDKAIIESEKDELFKLYLTDRPRMKDTISFNDYLTRLGYSKHIEMNIDKRDTEEIYNELEEIYKKFKENREG